MFSRCECIYCNGGIEFEIAEFQPESSTRDFIFGQRIYCPHCGKITPIYLESRLKKKPPPLPVKPENRQKIAPPAIKRAQIITTHGESSLLKLGFGILILAVPCIGPLIGSMILVYNENAGKFTFLSCSNCGKKLPSDEIKTCPRCNAQFY